MNDRKAIDEFITNRDKEMEEAGHFFVCDKEDCQ